MKEKQEKYIDLSQFPHNKQGNISWKNSIGKTIEFFYNGEKHIIKILKIVKKDYLSIKLDEKILEKVHTTKIKNLTFCNELYKPNYLYNIGDVIKNIKILKQTKIEKTSRNNYKVHVKGYLCECLIDGYTFTMSENDIKNGHGCPVCSGNIVVKGINDIATKRPDLVPFFVNVEDAYNHSEKSSKKVLVKCPFCGFQKYMIISDLSYRGYVTCDKCCDGISYPNKFAHELFSQLKDQCLYYYFEYSPNWADKKRYDNYVVLKNGEEIIVEMDGTYHYINNSICQAKSDALKNKLAEEHNIKLIRINCNYKKLSTRFDFIKENIIKELGDIFDLSIIDWDKCNTAAISNKLIDVITYYNTHPRIDLYTIADTFKISMETLYNYLYIGEDLNLCKYIRNDKNRVKNSKPITMYDLEHNLIGIFKSARFIEEKYPYLKARSIRQYIHENKIYKNYIFRFATYEEYQAC